MMKYLNNQSKSLKQIHALALGSVIAACLSQSVRADDAYEDNDSSFDPPYAGMVLNDPLSSIAGYGEQFDQDWYSLTLPIYGKEIEVEIEWIDIPGGQSLSVFHPGDSGGKVIYGDWEAPETRTVTLTPTGPVTAAVIGQIQANSGGRYDLRYYYTDEDSYEEKNLSDDRFNAGYRPKKGLALSNDQGLGKLYDSDDFRLQVPAGQEQLVIDCRFAHIDGDIDLVLVNPDLPDDQVDVLRAQSGTDNELIVYNLPPEGGNYHIVVYSKTPYRGQTYDLSWTTRNPLKMAKLAKCRKLKRKIKVARRKKQAAKVRRLKKSYRKCLRRLR